jgi:protein-S-isoprenylcysteine O-methyltransferase Ste14
MNHLWLYLVIGYAVIWAAMIWADKKRGQPIEDVGLYQRISQKQMALRGYLPLLALLATSIFIPANSARRDGAPLFWVGVGLIGLGVALNCVAMASFSRMPGGLNTNGVYRFSRNPMYVGGFLFLVGLNILGWRLSFANFAFAALTLVWASATHWTVLQEEAFLSEKYGRAYAVFKRKIPRYVGIPK